MTHPLTDEPITVDGLQYTLNAFDVLKCVNQNCLYLTPSKWDQREFLKQAFEEKAIVPVSGSVHGQDFDGNWMVTELRYNELGTLILAVLEKHEQ